MAYEFDTPVNRFGTDSMKWSVGEDELPLWVADMDFKTAPEIRDALRKRIDHGVFGYTEVPQSWYEAYSSWWADRHNFPLQTEWLIFTTGVVPAISSIVRKLTSVGENVLIQSPVYNIFYNSIINNGRTILESPLVYEEGRYSIDFSDLEEKLRDPQTSLMVLCNPHNPVGKVWEPETLAQIGQLCEKHHVIVLSDEIHCDLTDPGISYTPFASVSKTCRENSVTCLAPTKTFNLAGLQSAAVSIANPHLRHKVYRALNTDEVAEPNVFAAIAAVSAFTEGGHWLDELRDYLYQNKCRVRSYISEHIAELSVVPSDATYLLWIDCRNITQDSDDLQRFLRERTGVYLSEGSHYGTGGEGFLRMNTACPRSVLDDALSRIEQGMASYREYLKGEESE